MILSLFSLCPEVTASIKESQIAIENAFAGILDEKYEFKNYSSEKLFLSDFATAIAEDSIIVATAEPAYYLAFKNFICNAFQMKCKPNKNISSWIIENHPEMLDDEVEPHSNIPVNATPLLSQDGINSGFGLKVKKQLLIVLPLDVRRIDQIINAALLSYVRSNMDLSVLATDPLRGMTEDMSGLARAEAAETVVRQETRAELYDTLLISECVNKLRANGLTVSLANTKTVDFIGNISKTAVDLGGVVFISPYLVEKGEMTSRDYAVNLAKGALINSKNSIGAAITKVFSTTTENGQNQYFMYVCIADAENANVAKLIAEPGETPPQLIYRACEELFRMLNLWMNTGYAAPQYGETPVIRPDDVVLKDNPKLNKLKIVVSAIIGAGSLISILLSFLVQNIYGVL